MKISFLFLYISIRSDRFPTKLFIGEILYSLHKKLNYMQLPGEI